MSLPRFLKNHKALNHTDMSGDTLVFYHANCLDGIVAAMVAVRALSDDEDAHIYPVPLRYGDLTFIDRIKPRSEIYFVDFSLPPHEMLELIRKCDPISITVIDHHKTFIDLINQHPAGRELLNAEANHRTLVRLYLSEEGHSGASLCQLFWNDLVHLTPEEKQLIELTRTFDLWEHGGDTSHDASYLAAYMSLVIAQTKTEPETDYRVRSRGIGVPLSVALAVGKSEQEKLEAKVDACLNQSAVGMYNEVHTRRVLVVQAEASLVPTICYRYKDLVDFFVFWRHNTADRQPSGKHGVKYSLRSGRAPEIDLAALAARLDDQGKGGGHKQAAGFVSKLPWHELLNKIDPEIQHFQPFENLHNYWCKLDKGQVIKPVTA